MAAASLRLGRWVEMDETALQDETLEQAILEDFDESTPVVPDVQTSLALIAYTLVGILAELKRGRYAHDGD